MFLVPMLSLRISLYVKIGFTKPGKNRWHST